MIARLLHWWRLATEPSELIVRMAHDYHWRVRYPNGDQGPRLPYRKAYRMAREVGGTVESVSQ